MSELHVEDRRQFLKKAATVAWATPLVLTMTASGAGAQSCLPSLTICGIPDGEGCDTTGFVACCPGFSCSPVQLGLCRCN